MCFSPLFRLRVKVPSFANILTSPIQPGAGLVIKGEGMVMSKETRDQFIVTKKANPEDFQEIPCRRCLECRLAYSRNWAMRIMHEASLSDHNYFVTLTYQDYFLPQRTIVNDPVKYAFDLFDGNLDDFDSVKVGTLCPDHLSSFLKRFRQQMRRKGLATSGIRFYACGEYGEVYKRPHYHLILFNCPLPDLEFVGRSQSGFPLYSSQHIYDAWKFPIFVQGKTEWITAGIHQIGEVTFESAAYVARYVLKKSTGRDSEDAKMNYICDQISKDGKLDRLIDFSKWIKSIGGTLSNTVQGEFVRMSNRPGIGRRWAEDNLDSMYSTDEVFMKNAYGVVPLKPCSYYDKIYDAILPVDYQNLKQQRQARAANRAKLEFQSYSGLSSEQIRQQKAERKERRQKIKREFSTS